jgi:ectoine hydroxylase-related dioxygenase (phytanoyl-CoA dioxygenase family)
MSLPEPTVRLTQDQIDTYRERGFLRLDRITSDEEIEELLEIYERLFLSDTHREDRKQLGDIEEGEETLPQILSPDELAPELLETQYYANAEAVAEQLLGEDVEFRGNHAIRKPAGSGAETPWHQDEAYWDPALRYDALSFWMPLQEATVENGCMQFVPESNGEDVRSHHQVGDEAEALEVDDPEQYHEGSVACELPPGGATIHSSRTLHYAGPNTTDEPRRAYILTFGAPSEERDEPRDFHWQE